MSIPVAQFITPPSPPLSPLGVHTFVWEETALLCEKDRGEGSLVCLQERMCQQQNHEAEPGEKGRSESGRGPRCKEPRLRRGTPGWEHGFPETETLWTFLWVLQPVRVKSTADNQGIPWFVEIIISWRSLNEIYPDFCLFVCFLKTKSLLRASTRILLREGILFCLGKYLD